MCDLSIVLVVVRIKILCNTNLPALHNSVALVRLPVGNRRTRKPNTTSNLFCQIGGRGTGIIFVLVMTQNIGGHMPPVPTPMLSKFSM